MSGLQLDEKGGAGKIKTKTISVIIGSAPAVTSAARAGVEYRFEILAQRTGMKRVSGDNALTLGGGIKVGWFGVDYGFQAAGGLDQPIHKFTLNMGFGATNATNGADDTPL